MYGEGRGIKFLLGFNMYPSAEKCLTARKEGEGGLGTDMSGGRNLLPKFMPISFFRLVSRFWGVRTPGAPIRKTKCILECYPVLSFHGLKSCKAVSRFDLVDLFLDADHALDY